MIKDQLNHHHQLFIYLNVIYIQNTVKLIIDGLIDNLNDSSISKSLIIFFAKLTKQFSYPPHNYLTKFELDRIQFTNYGQYQTQNKAAMQMTILHFFIIRILLQEILNKPWISLEGVTENPIIKQNVFYICAVIQFITLNYLKSITAVYPESQLHVLKEYQNNQRPGYMKARADVEIDKQDQQDFQKFGEPLILGFPLEVNMQVVFSNDQWNQDRKYTLQGFGDKLVEMVLKVQNTIPDFKFNPFEQMNLYLKSKEEEQQQAS